MKPLQAALRNKSVRLTLIVGIVTLTFGVFIYYVATHPEVLESVANLDPMTLALLTIAYTATIIINAFVLWVSLRMIAKKVPFFENIALTGYSSVVNFFGPLQSGPGFRAAYLKKRHNVSLKTFFYVTVVFYGFFAAINTLILAGAFMFKYSNIWLSIGILLIATIVGLGGYYALSGESRLASYLRSIKLADVNFWFIGAGALALTLATTCAYFVELTHVESSISFFQALTYAAAANLALFVSLTPGAIGFRESFLLISQQLHEISTNAVIAASVIDRAFYVVFLLVMFIVLLVFGARSKLKQS